MVGGVPPTWRRSGYSRIDGRRGAGVAPQGRSLPLLRRRRRRVPDSLVDGAADPEIRCRFGLDGPTRSFRHFPWALVCLRMCLRLLAPAIEGENYNKDIDFGASGLQMRREAGYAHARQALER